MPRIYSETDEKNFTLNSDDSILQSSLQAGIQHIHVCGGKARCSTCRVQITQGIEHCQSRNEAESQMREQLNLPDDIRLACQTRIDGDISMRRMVMDDLDVRIIKDQMESHMLGTEKDIAVLFVDLANYTEFAESLPAYDVVHVINRYYLSMNAIIEEHHGVISDVAGDGMLVLFGACDKSTGHVENAIQAVHAMQKKLKELNTYLQSMYDRTFGLRAGIHYGSAIVGHFSTGPMQKVAAIGDAVNLAARIEQANKQFGTQLLISEAAYKQVTGKVGLADQFEAELKGKKGTYALFAVNV